MKILVINAGSSSLKAKLFENGKSPSLLAKGHIDGINLKNCRFTFSSKTKNIGQQIKIKNYHEALGHFLKTLIATKVIKDLSEIKALGHRVVHGGEKYQTAVHIDKHVLGEIKKLNQLAPLHNPANLEAINICRKIFKKIPQVAVFDTAFHQSLPEKAYLYGLPLPFYKKYQIRRYGFHGTNHRYLVNEAGKLLKKKKTKIITCHLGNGCSITASIDGKAVDTTMGFTPLEGLIMGTRSGSIDPAVIFHLIQKTKMKPAKIYEILNNQSGLKGLSEISSDMREIYAASKKNNHKATLAMEILSYQIAKFCGAFTTAMNGLDAIVFSGGIGEKAFYIREKALAYLDFLGVKLDKKANEKNLPVINTSQSKIKLFIIPANEELQINLETLKIVNRK